MPGAAVQIGATTVATTYVSEILLQARVPFFLTSVEATVPVSVLNTRSVLSNSINLIIGKARPVLNASGIVNAASYEGGGVSPGELIVLFGAGLGPETLIHAQPTDGASFPLSLGGTQILFDGQAAPLTYTSAGQVSAAVPFGLESQSTVAIVVDFAGQKSVAITIPVLQASPGIFTQNSSGRGSASALNQNGTLNSSANPARKGSVVVLYGTGFGRMNSSPVDGSFAELLSTPLLPVTASIGGFASEVLFAGAAPGLIEGVVQINLRVPIELSPGQHFIVVRAGSIETIQKITVSVE